jgi:hypothetical protein
MPLYLYICVTQELKIDEIWNEAGSSMLPIINSEKNELGFGPSWTMEYLQSEDAADA